MKSAQAIQQLKIAGVEAPEREVRYLLAHVLGIDFRRLSLEINLNEEQQKLFTSALERRCKREPLAYITGSQPFWTLNIHVNEHVLIPRPETEHVVEAALHHIKNLGVSKPHMLDLCTGSGCIPASLASELPEAHFTVTDLSLEALKVAQQNLSFAKERTQFLQGDLFAALPTRQQFHCITANPPYVAEHEWAELSPEVQHEPKLALLGPEEGLAVSQKIIQDAAQFLLPGAALILEYGLGQTQALLKQAEKHHYQMKHVIKDLAGIERVLVLVRE